MHLAWGSGQTHTLGAEEENEVPVAPDVTCGRGEGQVFMSSSSYLMVQMWALALGQSPRLCEFSFHITYKI